MTQQAPAGWYPDPNKQAGQERYWDGQAWTEQTRPAGMAPPVAPAPVYVKPRKRRGCLTTIIAAVILLVVVIVIIAVGASGSSKPGSGTSSHPAADDISVSRCKVDSLKIPQATGMIDNHSSGTSDYTFTVSFLNAAGTVVAQGGGLENDIASHQQATWSVTGDAEVSVAVTCKVVDVTRFASS
jgi:hypothetical protein